MKMARVEIVLAHKDHREAVKRREIQRFMEMPLFGGAIAKERDRHSRFSAKLRRECRTDRKRNRRSDQRHGSQDADLSSDQMHGAPPAAGAAGCAPKDLGDERPEIAALG